MSAGSRCQFLGWSSPFLPEVARWLVRHRDLSNCIVALPGSRAARALLEHLVDVAGAEFVPPRIVTQGELVDELVRLDRPVASRLARTLAWAEALRALEKDELEAITARAPETPAAWLRLAEVVRALHGELAPEAVSFADIAGRQFGENWTDGEERRWKVLARVQARWRELLDRAGVLDPHEGRSRAIAAGLVDTQREVVLAGVADANKLLRRALAQPGVRCTALVAAPASENAAFDELGTLVPRAWTNRELVLPRTRWHVVDRPADQAEVALELIAAWNGRFAVDDIVIGVADDEVVPALEQKLAAESVFARPAAGTPFEGTRVERLLALAAEFASKRSFSAWAAFARHPDVHGALRTALGERARDPAGLLDDYQNEHLPASFPEMVLQGEQDSSPREPEAGKLPARARHEQLELLANATRALLGDLWKTDERKIGRWSSGIRALLSTVYARELHPRIVEDDRVLTRSLEILAGALDEIESLPESLASTPMPSSAALELVLAATENKSIPARSPAADEATIELLGWLELALDDARAMVVTGFNEGRVPRSTIGDPFLPDGLRAALGLAHEGDRIARDLYAARLLLESRAEVEFISGRRTRDGDPLFPSRLVFQDRGGDEAERVKFFYAERPRAPSPSGRDAQARELPRGPSRPLVEAMSVSSFRDYLESPYRFYLRHVLRLETIDDRARELDPLAFGSLAHDVLARFGADVDSGKLSDADAIAADVIGRLERLAAARFGGNAHPAVSLQVERLKHRFQLFAAHEARRRRDGWRIHAVEWSPESRPVLVAGEHSMQISGRIDRIDVRGEGEGREWAILDYKTGDTAKTPSEVHQRKNRTWRDLQLPLYTVVADSLQMKGKIDLGYYAIGKDDANTGVLLVDWDDDELASALETARRVVRSVRAGEFWDVGRGVGNDSIFRAIVGAGLLTGDANEDGDARNEDGDEGGGE